MTYKNDKKQELELQLQLWVAATIPSIERGVALGISVADYVWEYDFHNWIDDKTEGN
jgi:hypothetical protein